ncbi:hypothetical protein HN51_020602 [Arachis hypogaea]|uniref:uncharacterized protein n=1 Tax=Arachis hypogaea TaxID=3818 RepID=UPI000DECB12F|nr:uncharacterized protein LOC112708035 [Arachis hypogaea]XP_025615918.1 uncharacterized protein LOC112708035 [Arachis hypogaea]QHO32587.1 uncharacterized protein DS421_8g251100 [Arachis hypogaea]
MDAVDYCIRRRLKQKLQHQLNQLAGETPQEPIHYDPLIPMMKVEAQEGGFMIKVVSERNCKGLLEFILEAFQDLGLDVLHARVSSVDTFSLETFGVKENNEDTRYMDAQSVEQAVSQAIQKWKKVN